MSKPFIALFFILLASFSFLILSLNYNVKTFKLTQLVQDVTLKNQTLEQDVIEIELDYLSQIKLTNIYNMATTTLNMIHQPQPKIFFNSAINTQ